MVDGFEEVEKERNDIILYGSRKVCYHVVRALAGKKGFKKEEDVFPLAIDKAIKRAKVKKMKPVKITRIAKDGQ